MTKLFNKLWRNPIAIFLLGAVVGLSIPSLVAKPIQNLIFQQFIATKNTFGKQLPLPSNLISLVSPEGKELLIQSKKQEDYWYLSPQFVTQKSQSFVLKSWGSDGGTPSVKTPPLSACGVATMVMVLNALSIPAPVADEYYPFRVFTQDNFFNSKARSVIAPEIVSLRGIALEELKPLLESYPVKAQVYHSTDTNIKQFRKIVSENLKQPNNFVIVNYLRKAINQESGGHISALAAYNEKADRFLILDLSRYKYPPVWVKTKDLWKAMDTKVSVTQKTRGFILVSRN